MSDYARLGWIEPLLHMHIAHVDEVTVRSDCVEVCSGYFVLRELAAADTALRACGWCIDMIDASTYMDHARPFFEVRELRDGE